MVSILVMLSEGDRAELTSNTNASKEPPVQKCLVQEFDAISKAMKTSLLLFSSIGLEFK